ncbi:hypothetical protein N7G274_002026 [Stereocaulon virgatum]|uniref:Uncharacterized protein n=1 Tax=Stereocaulon virgatum TaxID=373712 RepID=A0ABR4AIJ0_9LECA
MDSDDEFISGISSQDEDFGGVEESDDGSLGDEFDEDDPDVGFSRDKDMKPGKKAYEVDFNVFSPQDIQSHQDKQIDEVSRFLDKP